MIVIKTEQKEILFADFPELDNLCWNEEALDN